MPSFIDKQLRQDFPSGKSEMQHKRDQTPVCYRNVQTKPLQSSAQFTNIGANVAQGAWGIESNGNAALKQSHTFLH